MNYFVGYNAADYRECAHHRDREVMQYGMQITQMNCGRKTYLLKL